MRKLFALAVVLLAATAVTMPVTAQVVATDAYQIGYFFNTVSNLDHFRIINTGQIGSPIDAATHQGTVCADVYLFDSNQEMAACCHCALTANELTEIDGAQPLTGVTPPTGVIKIVADAGCDETNITAPVNAGLRAFQTNFQAPGAVTETLFQPAPLTVTEQQFLGQACSFVHYLGSGKGTCRCRKPRPPE